MMQNRPSSVSGFLLVHKPPRMTSHDVVDAVRRITGMKRVGHAGTLDPSAEGLLIVLVGDATVRQREFMAGEKEYLATIHLGARSTTDDAEGIIEPVEVSRQPEIGDIRKALTAFVGEIEQVPPAYSAVKVGGVRAYALARSGMVPKLRPRRVTVRTLKLLRYRWPLLRVRIVCSPGTYIRALGRDLGRALGCGAYLEALTRTRSGNFHLDEAVPLRSLTAENWREYLRAIPT